MYDTGVALDVLDREVSPHFADDIVFIDPAVTSRGYDKVRRGMQGFHCTFKFELEIAQLAVQMKGSKGRALIDGVMNLRSVPGFVYPLRTFLVYEFELDGDKLSITKLEELWPLGDLIANTPLAIGKLYRHAARPAFGVALLALFDAVRTLRNGRVRPSKASR